MLAEAFNLTIGIDAIGFAGRLYHPKSFLRRHLPFHFDLAQVCTLLISRAGCRPTSDKPLQQDHGGQNSNRGCRGPLHLGAGLRFDALALFARLALAFFGFAFRCCGAAFAISRMNRSKRGHASGTSSISPLFGLCLRFCSLMR